MRHFLYSDYDYWCCQLVVLLFMMLNISSMVFTKCTLNKHDVTCFGRTWKQDLLPIENNSLEKLHITKCGQSRTQYENLDINFLRNVTKLTFLSMTECQLTVPPIINYQINSIEIIDLSNNLIDTNAQFPVLGLDFFKRFPYLKVLNLTNNKLTNLPKSWFDCPSPLETLILDGNLIGGLNPSLASCFVKLKHLSLKRNQFERLRTPSDPRRTSSRVHKKDSDGLKIFGDQNAMMPQTDRETDHKEESIVRGRHDYIGVIPHFKALEILDLSHNAIKSIDQIPLSNLENLFKVNLSHNRLSSNTAPENGCDFGTAPFYINGKSGISELDLSGNIGLTRIHSCWTFGLKNLRVLRMENCSVSSIQDLSFDKMKSLDTLDLSRNRLNNVPKEIIVVSKSLSSLNLAYNNISQLTSSYLSSMENLRILNLSYNNFQNLMSYAAIETENKVPDSIGDFLANTRDSNPEEPINLLGQMRQLQTLDLSYNNLVKVSASADLSPSIKTKGELQRVDLRGNSAITQFSDFNLNDITTTLTEFLINDDLKLHCDCVIVGFIKWVNQRQLEVSGKCSTPRPMSHLSISDPQLLTVILSDNSCKDIQTVTSMKTTFRLKLSSNANLSFDHLQSDNDPMDDGQKRSANQKRQIDYQKWVVTGANLTLRCEFNSTYEIKVPINIEWQRTKRKPLDKQDNQPSYSHFSRTEKSDTIDNFKYREQIERLSSNYDPRIKTMQIGPVDGQTFVDHLWNSKPYKNLFNKDGSATYKYVGFLLLKPMYLSDNGRYRCLINNLPTVNLYGQNQVISKEENINVFTPPRFTSTPSNPMSIIEGETAEITCRANGNPSPMTSLGRIGSKDFPAARGRRMTIFKDDSSFFITNVRQIDAGNYSCTSRNAAGIISYNFTLKVQMPASIVNKPPSQKNIRLGESLIISFRVNGVPTPEIKWFKNGKRIVENDRIKFGTDHLMLVIPSTVVTDAGNYKISALNALGGNDASVSVSIIDSQGRSFNAPPPSVKQKSTVANTDKEPTWLPDYWLSVIIIIVILSILITSILWITIFFCFTKIIGSNKRRLLLLSNSKYQNSFDKTQTTATSTTSFTNAHVTPKPCIPLSLTTSTIVGHDTDVDTFTDTTKTPSSFYSPQLYRGEYASNNRLLSSSYLSSSGIDLLSSRCPVHQQQDMCDSGIDSSQVYSETLNSADLPVYQCRHKSKHRTKNYQKQRPRYLCSNSSDSSEAAMKGRKDAEDSKTDAEDSRKGREDSRKDREEDSKEEEEEEEKMVILQEMEITNTNSMEENQQSTQACTTPLIATRHTS